MIVLPPLFLFLLKSAVAIESDSDGLTFFLWNTSGISIKSSWSDNAELEKIEAGKSKQTNGYANTIRCSKCCDALLFPPTIVIPVFERDLCKLSYTLRSIAKLDDHNFLGDLYIAWVSVQPMGKYADEMKPMIRQIANTRHVTVRDFSRVLQAEGSTDGWHAQQVIKMKISSWINTSYYVILDAKNTFTRPIRRETFFTACNQAIINAEFAWNHMPGDYSFWYNNSAALLGIPPPTSGYWPQSITPAVIRTHSMRALLKHLGENNSPDHLCDGPLCEKLRGDNSPTTKASEFTLYFLWAQNQSNLKCIHFWRWPTESTYTWSKGAWRGNSAIVNERMTLNVSNSHNPPLTFAVQSGAFEQSSPDRRRQVASDLARLYDRLGLLEEENPKIELWRFFYCAIGGTNFFDNATLGSLDLNSEVPTTAVLSSAVGLCISLFPAIGFLVGVICVMAARRRWRHPTERIYLWAE